MAEWRTPVFDRTMDDVKSVDRTSATYQKGTLNADDLNRIEDNYKYLMAKLRSDAIFIPHRLRNYTETAMEYVEKESQLLPDGYTQVEYIESSGTQYIDTGFKPNQDTRVVMEAQMLNDPKSSTAIYFGCRDGKFFELYKAGSGQNLTFLYNSDYSQYFTVNYLARRIVEINKNSATVDGTTLTYSAGTFQLTQSLYLGADNESGTAKAITALRIYSCQIYDNGTLIRDYVPCTNSEGVAGLYDLANDVFYTDAAGGAFTAGAEIELEPETSYELVETKTIYTDWQEHNLPWLSEINRIRANYNALVRLFLVGLGLPVSVESNYLDYVEVNEWERIALVGKKMFENMELEYRYCGMEDSGGGRLL